MRYRNAEEILPKHLLEGIQNYIEGEYLYIPVYRARKAWGENSGSRKYLAHRNACIKQKAQLGYSIKELAIEHYLFESSIRKIIKQQ